MAFKSIITLVLLALHMPAALSQAPQLEHPLPALTIEDRGEILLQGNDFTYDSWSSETSPNGVHVLQYLAATRTASKLFEPLTDGLQASFDRNDYHVTTIIISMRRCGAPRVSWYPRSRRTSACIPIQPWFLMPTGQAQNTGNWEKKVRA